CSCHYGYESLRMQVTVVLSVIKRFVRLIQRLEIVCLRDIYDWLIKRCWSNLIIDYQYQHITIFFRYQKDNIMIKIFIINIIKLLIIYFFLGVLMIITPTIFK